MPRMGNACVKGCSRSESRALHKSYILSCIGCLLVLYAQSQDSRLRSALHFVARWTPAMHKEIKQKARLIGSWPKCGPSLADLITRPKSDRLWNIVKPYQYIPVPRITSPTGLLWHMSLASGSIVWEPFKPFVPAITSKSDPNLSRGHHSESIYLELLSRIQSFQDTLKACQIIRQSPLHFFIY